MKFSSYLFTSFLGLLSLVYYAYYTQKQFYPTVLFLVSSKLSYVVAGNMVLASALVMARLFKSIYFGQLREVEVELLIEKGKYIFVETCFALTIFRNELSTAVMGLFGVLIFIKLLHKLSKCRLEYMEQIMPVSFYSQCRLAFLLLSLILLDTCGAYFSLAYIMKNGRSVLILFGFEFGLQFIYAVNLIIRFSIQIADSRLANGLPSRGLYLMLTDLVCEAVKLITYVSFFCLVFVYYGVPIHIMRDVYAAYMSFYRKLLSFIKYLRLTRNLDGRFPDATPEEIVASGSCCLVCREDMDRGKKLPCSHVFHLDCLRAWLQHQQSCPLCRADIPVTSDSPVNAAAAAAGAADGDAPPQANNLAGGGFDAAVVVDQTPAAAARPQDVHVSVSQVDDGATVGSDTSAGALRISESKGTQQQQFPSFYVVVAEPDLAVLSDPSRQGKELRRVKKGLVVFVTLRVKEQDGTQWLRAPDGWILEKLVLCGSCCSNDTGSSPSMCWHDQLFMAPLMSTGERSASAESSSLPSTPLDNVREHPPVASAGMTAVNRTDRTSTYTRYNNSSSGSVGSNRPPFSADISATEGVAFDQMSSKIASDLEMTRALVARLEGLCSKGINTSGITADGNAAARLSKMAALQTQMEEVTHNMLKLNAAVLVCQQTMSQLIQDEITASQLARLKIVDCSDQKVSEDVADLGV